MSVPWEIMHDTWTSKRGGELVRYLRADLTCGECGYLRDDAYYSVLCTKHSWEIAAENPACMAFKPKEEGK